MLALNKHRWIWAAALVLALVLPLPAKDKKTKEEKRREQEVKAAQKQERQYEKLRQFAINLYENDLEFREAVDRDYEEVMRSHSEQAFQTNLSRKSITVSVQEDRFRRHFHLYDNPAVQYYVNSIAQRLAPPDTDKLFAVRLTPSPIPSATTLATGTIYVSTGLVSMLENEAQLAYVVAHEMAHVLKDHWRLKSMMRLAEPAYNEKQAQKAAWISLIASGIGAGIGAAASRSSSGAAVGAAAGLVAGAVAGAALNPLVSVDFDKVQEDEADREAFQILLRANYDPGEVPRLFLVLQNTVNLDSRASLGFIGQRRRIRERLDNCKDLIEKAYKADIELKKSKGALIGDNPQFRHLIAELKRDNGILEYYYDMFALAKNNLADAVAIRSNDPSAQYYYGKVLQLTARTPEDRRAADEAFRMAIQHDARGLNFGAHLHRALMMMGDLSNLDKAKIVEELQAYVDAYIKYSDMSVRGAAYLPPNLESVYDYLMTVGEFKWVPTLPENPVLLNTQWQKPGGLAQEAEVQQPVVQQPVVQPAVQPVAPTPAPAKPLRNAVSPLQRRK